MITKIKNFDLGLLVGPVILCAIGIAVIFSLVYAGGDATVAYKQGIFAILGLIIMFVVAFIDYRSFRNLWWLFYFITLLLLVVVDAIGKTALGATRWINLGFFQLQPSELAKISMIFVFSSFFYKRIGNLSLKYYIWSIILIVPPLVLILKEPDLGTALVVVFIYAVTLVISRPSIKQYVYIGAVLILLSSAFVLSVKNIAPFGKLLKNYQRNRIMTFVNPQNDPLSTGYNVKQAEISIGSGGLFGQGLGRGSQSQLKFLPEAHTDFIFAGTGEALGFTGSVLIVAIFLFLIIRMFSISSYAKDSYGLLLASGVGAMMLFQTVINIGMNLGLAPVTGIPLPFMSYGGTSLVICLTSVGLIQSIYQKERNKFFN
jgi:rod shape determining protein RodA